MANLLVRNLDDDVLKQLKAAARAHGRSLQAEIHDVLCVADIGRIAVETVSCRALAEDAHALANATGRTVYDSMYVALAVRLNTRSITADDRLEAALRNVPAVAGHIQLVQTFERDVQEREDSPSSD
jgi:plasmid stability protein